MLTARKHSFPREDTEALQLYASNGPLCPNVQTLVWSNSVPSLRFLPLFVTPRIRSLSVQTFALNRGKDTRIESQYLAEIILGLGASTLTRLSLPSFTVSSLTPQVQQQIASLVLQCGPALTTLHLNVSLPEHVLLHVMTLQNLREWMVRDHPPPKIPKSMVVMPSIKTLDLPGISSSRWLSILQGRHSHIPHTTMTDDPRAPHSTLETLIFSPEEGLGPATINPTLTFTCLTTLDIRGLCASSSDGRCRFNLTDDDILRLATALPQLIHLLLGTPCVWNACQTTFRSLLSLSAHCSKLSTLETHVNTRDIARDVELLLGIENSDTQNLRSRRRCGLSTLSVGYTPLVLDDTEMELVARGFFDVFPMLRKVRPGLRARDYSWNKVRELVLELKRNS